VQTRILITGASGFIGTHCFKHLCDNDYDVYGLTGNKDILKNRVKFYYADYSNKSSLVELFTELKPTHLIHCAWIATPGVFWTSDKNIGCVINSINLYQAFCEAGGKKILSLGSCAEYEWNTAVYSESNSAAVPSTAYGKSKLSTLNALAAIKEIYGIEYIWARLFFPYGPGESKDKLISSVIRSIQNKEIIKCSPGQQIKDFIYISDVVEAISKLLFSKSASGIFNIGSGTGCSVREVIEMLIQKMNGKNYVSFSNSMSRSDEPNEIVADVSRIKNECIWNPKINLSEGLDLTIQSLTR